MHTLTPGSRLLRGALLPVAWLLLLGSALSARAQISISVASYGANPADQVSDQAAFEAAAAALKSQMQANPGQAWQLVIPATSPGQAYLVGRQTPRGTALPQGGTQDQYLVGVSPLSLNLAGLSYTSLTIGPAAGSGQAQVRYQAPAGQPFGFGSFDDNGNPYPGITTNPHYAATVGDFLDLLNCHHVSVANLEVDGRSQDLRLGGQFGDTGIQLSHSGVFINSGQTVSLTNVVMRNFGLDGIMVANPTTQADFNNPGVNHQISLAGCTFDGNGRQGLSWVGGKGLTAYKCSFNRSGRTVNAGTGTALASSPAAGIDIEPEGGNYARNLVFNTCAVIDNYARGVISDGQGTYDLFGADYTFSNCTIWHTTSGGPGVYNTRPRVNFYDCNIYGRIQACYSHTNDPALSTKFFRCNIEDKSYNGQPVYLTNGDTDFLLNMYVRTQSTLFEDCQFTVNMWAVSDSYFHGTSSDVWTVFRNCRFNVKWQRAVPNTSQFTGAVFEGNNSFVDALPGGTNYQNSIRLRLALVTSDRANPAKHTLTIATGSRASWIQDDSEADYANPQPTDNVVTIGKDATDWATLMLENNTYYYQYGELYLPRNLGITQINEQGLLGVRGGATFRINDAARITVKGRFIADNDAELDVRQYSGWTFGPQSELYIAQNTTMSGYGMFFNFNTCVHGGKAQFGVNGGCPVEAASFNGKDQIIVAPDPDKKTALGTDPFTLEANYNTFGTQLGMQGQPTRAHFITTAVYDPNGQVADGYDFGLDSDGLFLRLPGQTYYAPIEPSPGCHQASVTRSLKGVISIYYDGKLLKTFFTKQVVNLGTSGKVLLGSNGNKEALAGILNEVRVWRTELSQGDIYANRDASQVTLYPNKYLLAYWNLRQLTTDQEAADLSAVFPWDRISGYRGYNPDPQANDPYDPSWVATGQECRDAFEVALTQTEATPQLDGATRYSFQAEATRGRTGNYDFTWLLDRNDGNGFQPVSTQSSSSSSSTYSFTTWTDDYFCVRVVVNNPGAQTAQATLCTGGGGYGASSRTAGNARPLAYPNPANEYTLVQAPEAAPAARPATAPAGSEPAPGTATLYNALGQVVYTGRLTGSELRLETSQLPAGVYQLRLVYQGQTSTQRLLIQH